MAADEHAEQHEPLEQGELTRRPRRPTRTGTRRWNGCAMRSPMVA
jgi:hypothetical protein